MEIVKIICTIIGTFIGAGFASGKEIYIFFYKYDLYGIVGIIISCLFVGIIIFKVIKIVNYYSIKNYNEFLNYIIENKSLKKFLIYIIDVFLIISFCVMVTGFLAFMYQEFKINKFISLSIMIFFLYLLLRKKADGIIKINNITIPIIIFVILYVAIKKVDLFNIEIFISEDKNKVEFLISSILYANYNLLTIIPIVVTVSSIIKKRKNIMNISIISTIILLILSISIFFILNQKNINIEKLDMPVVFIVGSFGKIYKYIYCGVIGIAIFTTAISVGYGYLQKYENNKKIYNKKINILLICAIISTSIGFSKLIEFLYPAFGIIGLLQSYEVIRKYKLTKNNN